jgi:hypothetical protein
MSSDGATAIGIEWSGIRESVVADAIQREPGLHVGSLIR